MRFLGRWVSAGVGLTAGFDDLEVLFLPKRPCGYHRADVELVQINPCGREFGEKHWTSQHHILQQVL